MANIKISALLPVGYDLFNDTASFLNELATDEVQNVIGGGGGWGGGGWGGNSRCYNPCCCWSCC
ncbi:hypothetical protein MEO40_18540 [Dolichospermum sp. ST_sed1]|nr:hypothetical protein [Dolichospermum sp. ST_sed1]MDD1429023.1 hypothetical protein [Dolichospermum sp. ST_sed9]MDD1444232.1 hypothetical protein [Dolichospermum sp. ST_sed3]MDD1449573.1 hypothetical protein [Dolichospermum sp. ST_sed8]MDD1459118.1 hypothetical protein [Dolichospermum sp. ST_sed2]MDD1474831.1 hypothetical protein [Dolichospermum sp. ST_sed4]